MPGPAGILLALIVSAQSPLELGKAAMDAHDPTAAIAHFEKVDSQEGRAWLAVALMMESRSPSDQYVERAFEAAARSRSEKVEWSRAELAAALQPGEMVIATLIGEKHAYAWAFDRDAMIGYPLPPPREIATAVERINAYGSQHDSAGMARIAEEFVPSLLGPVADRGRSLTRLIFVMDGPLRQLPINQVFVGDLDRVRISLAGDQSLLHEIQRQPSLLERPWSDWRLISAVLTGIAIALISLLKKHRSRAPS